VTSSEEVELDEIVPGSIIQRKLKSAWIPLAKHIGIYVSDEQVIHFSGEHVFRSDFVVCRWLYSRCRRRKHVGVCAPARPAIIWLNNPQPPLRCAVADLGENSSVKLIDVASAQRPAEVRRVIRRCGDEMPRSESGS
jgi:hypothetical protein